MFVGTALFVRLFVYAGLSLFIISGPYLHMVVCILYVYNLTIGACAHEEVNTHSFASLYITK